MRLFVTTLCVAAALLCGTPAAQQPPAPAPPTASAPADPIPTLTVEQRQAVQLLAQAIEIAQLRAQQAQRDFDQARAELGKLIQSLQVDGYTLDLTKLEYAKKPPAPPAEAPIKK